MKRRCLFVVTVFTLVVGLMGGSIWAASPKMNVEVPFAFTVQGKSMPAGSYVILLDGSNNSRVILRNGRAGETITLPIMTRLADLGVTSARLVFDKAGDQHYLSEIHIPGMDGFALQGAPDEHGHELVAGTE